MKFSEKCGLVYEISYIRAYVEQCITDVNSKQLALRHIDRLINGLDKVTKDITVEKVADKLSEQARKQADIRDKCSDCGEYMEAAFYDITSKALRYAKRIIVDGSNEEFSCKGAAEDALPS